MANVRIFHLEDLELSVPIYLDERCVKDFYDYPICATEPIYTGTGRPCVNAWQEACKHVKPYPYITVKKKDCGCCEYYQTEKERDLLGVCMCERNKVRSM